MTAGDAMIDAIAEAVFARIERKLATKKRIYSLDEAAEYLGLTRKALQQKVARGEIRPVDMDRLLRFDIVDLDAHIARSKRHPDAA